MKKISNRIGSRVLLAVLIATFAVGSALAQTTGMTGKDLLPPMVREIGIDQKLGDSLPLDLTFRDSEGRSVVLRDYFGKKPVILTFVYYECPMLCTMVLNGLTKAMRAISLDAGKDFEIVTISINPRETPALALAKKEGYVHDYARAGASQGWHFLVGDESTIRKAADAAGFKFRYDPDNKQYAHASGIMVLTPDGKFARYFYGVEYSARDLRLGLVEAGDRKIGSPVDEVLLFCFHYDPVSGKYGFVVMSVVRVLGVATVVALVAFMIVMLRRDRRLKPAAGGHRAG